MKAEIIDTIGDARKKRVAEFGILEIDDGLLHEQEDEPVDVTQRCRPEKLDPAARAIPVLTDEDIEELVREISPSPVTGNPDADAVGKAAGPWLWLHAGYLVKVTGIFRTETEKSLLVNEQVMKREKRLKKLERLVEMEGRIDQAAKREPIADDVRMFVWRRDQGRCVNCGCKRDLEFDHIVPVSKGGSGTVRNIQLLCALCNREKSDSI